MKSDIFFVKSSLSNVNSIIYLEHKRVLDDHVYIVMLQLLHSVIDVP